jgi:hypothetical protein
MHKKIFLTLLLAVPFFTVSKAQKNKKDSTVVIFFNENKSERSESKKTGEANIVKIAPLGFISGTYPILFERVITDFFTVQVGGGVTGKNYWRSAINKTGENSSIKMTYPWEDDTQYDQADGLFNYDTRTTGMGYMFSIQPRLYFESEAPDGSFVAISYDYLHYKFSIPGLTQNSVGDWVHKGAAKSEHENISDIMVHFGYQSVYDRLTMEYTTAIGMRNVKGTKYAGFNDGSVLTEGFATYKQSVFNFGIGIKVGYHF